MAILTSFAAREVFVGTMATLYSLGSGGANPLSLQQRMRMDVNEQTGKPVFAPATAISLLLFYAFAMQCVSTLVITFRETHKWKWPALQFAYMTGLAYMAAFMAYHLIR